MQRSRLTLKKEPASSTVSEGKNIYGSVGAKEIAAALAEKGLEIDSKIISVKAAKTLGNFEAVAQFHREVSVVIPFEVVNEDGTAAPAAQPAPAAEEAPATEEAPAETPAE